MATFTIIITIFVIIIANIQSEQQTCPEDEGTCTCSNSPSNGECILKCGSGDCDDTLLKCVDGYKCTIDCTASEACRGGADFQCGAATTCDVKCEGEEACKGADELTCGSSICSLSCSGSSSPCQGIQVITTPSTKSYQCTGSKCGNVASAPPPFSEPTSDPTMIPSFIPSKAPTKNPTTSNPTNKPTKIPTKVPSTNPTEPYPTSTPSMNPTKIPSSNPTKSPTNIPTLSPSTNPSISPSVTPSNNPTVSPSQHPSNIPTQYPTIPTLVPTNNPNRKPTAPTDPLTAHHDEDTTATPDSENAVKTTMDDQQGNVDEPAKTESDGLPFPGWMYIVVGSIAMFCCLTVVVVMVKCRNKKKHNVRKQHFGPKVKKEGKGDFTIPYNTKMHSVSQASPVATPVNPNEGNGTMDDFALFNNGRKSHFEQDLANNIVASDVMMDNIINHMSTPMGDSVFDTNNEPEIEMIGIDDIENHDDEDIDDPIVGDIENMMVTPMGDNDDDVEDEEVAADINDIMITPGNDDINTDIVNEGEGTTDSDNINEFETPSGDDVYNNPNNVQLTLGNDSIDPDEFVINGDDEDDNDYDDIIINNDNFETLQ